MDAKKKKKKGTLGIGNLSLFFASESDKAPVQKISVLSIVGHAVEGKGKQLNLELEQALTAKWSVVVFGDALGVAARMSDYPFSEKLYSVGLGIRYQTIIGPVRLEYGHNLNRRPFDPAGTLQVSIGFPF